MTTIFFVHTADALNTVTVMADGNLGMAMSEIARDYSRAEDVVVNTSFASSKTQETQITEGAAADVLITPRAAWIDNLKLRGLVDVYSQIPVARDQLALVGPIDSPVEANLAKSFPGPAIIHEIGEEPAFVVGNPQTLPEGIYGKEALRNMDALGYLEPYTVYPKRLDQMFEMVVNDNAYGVFFYSTAMTKSGLKVLGVFPEKTHRPIQYYAVVIAGENMDEARKFMEYLKSAQAKAVLRDNGFLTN